jgi:hypothetical protein
MLLKATTTMATTTTGVVVVVVVVETLISMPSWLRLIPSKPSLTHCRTTTDCSQAQS